MLIQLNIKLHSSKIILVAFCSGAFQGTFQYQFWNAWILPEWVTTGMVILAEPPANFHSSRMHWILPESPESSRNLWGTDKTSNFSSKLCTSHTYLSTSPFRDGITPWTNPILTPCHHTDQAPMTGAWNDSLWQWLCHSRCNLWQVH